ncbi:hypothetical protein, partial [Lentilactobacillus parafarraginis]|uniref:hypothetical protein n=1 Tax=Lentilactobacillus parafarraginis TaxID=390842 RepID=UPI001C6588F0
PSIPESLDPFLLFPKRRRNSFISGGSTTFIKKETFPLQTLPDMVLYSQGRERKFEASRV